MRFFKLALSLLTIAAMTIFNVDAQILPDKYYQPYTIQKSKIDSCIITRINSDSAKRVDLRVAYDRKGNKMTFLDQLNGSRIVFKYSLDSLLQVQEFYMKVNGKEQKAGMDSFFYDASRKKVFYHSIVKSKKVDVHITIKYYYKGDTLDKEEYRLNKDIFKTVYHSYDRINNIEMVTTVSSKEPNTNQFYKRDAQGKLVKYFSLNLSGDTTYVHVYKYDEQGRIVQTVTYDSRSNVSNIYKTTYYPNGMIKREEEYLNIMFGDRSTAIYQRKEYRYKTGKQ